MKLCGGLSPLHSHHQIFQCPSINLINHKIKYPGIVTWNDIDITMVDIGDKGKGQSTRFTLTFGSGYQRQTFPGLQIMVKTELIKNSLQSTSVSIFKNLMPKGKKIETWELINPFIKAIKYGDLDYSSDDLLRSNINRCL
jgi:hypothetical protein